jgi:dihydrofolate reductase
MEIAIISAMTKSGIIGNGNKLPWNIPEELKYFKNITLNKPIIMGNSTFESVGKRPLPNRLNIVLTRDQEKIVEFNQQHDNQKLMFVNNLEDSIAVAKDFYRQIKNSTIENRDIKNTEIMVIGGAKIYQQFLPLASKLYLSIIKDDYPGDVLFPEYDQSQWQLANEQDYPEFVAQVWVNPSQ